MLAIVVICSSGLIERTHVLGNRGGIAAPTLMKETKQCLDGHVPLPVAFLLLGGRVHTPCRDTTTRGEKEASEKRHTTMQPNTWISVDGHDGEDQGACK